MQHSVQRVGGGFCNVIYTIRVTPSLSLSLSSTVCSTETKERLYEITCYTNPLIKAEMTSDLVAIVMKLVIFAPVLGHSSLLCLDKTSYLSYCLFCFLIELYLSQLFLINMDTGPSCRFCRYFTVKCLFSSIDYLFLSIYPCMLGL